jgi:5-methylthioadenosine/S-adenosylhomocysteine deaminase
VPYGVPTTPNEYPLPGLQRISKKYFSSKDQLVTLGFAGGPTPIAGLPAPYTGLTGWALGREFGAFINNHNVGAPTTPAIALAAGLAPFDDVTLVHCTRWQDNSIAQISHSKLGYPNPATSSAWQIWADNGGHVSIACLIEQQMRHGMPPFQMALNHGILPSLSPDVDTNMTPDPFSLMRGAFVIQRALANDLTFQSSDPGGLPTPQLLTSKQCVQMMTVAGAAGSGLRKKVGTLTPGKQADIVMLSFDNINIQPMNNAYGSIVTLMDTRHVRHVMIAGKFVYWNGKLQGWDVDQVIRRAVRSRDRVLQRINGPAAGTDTGIINRTMNSFQNPYRPAFLTSCCYNGQNESAPNYVLRP